MDVAENFAILNGTNGLKLSIT